jgi:glyoxylase-like metal-dependent hydrolase (beta-lactamase superfamily II)
MSHGVVDLGDVTVTRLEESYGPAAPATVIMPSFDPGVREEFGPDTIAQFVVPETDEALLSVHTWVVRTPQKTILVDTCNGNHKQRNVSGISMLNTDWLERLVAGGVRPDEVDAVVCTHLHLDHVGWNTNLVDGQWVPTFPNARYYINRREYEFWNPSATEQTGVEFNGFVFDDSVKPVFDRGLVELWEGDGCDVDDHLHLELRVGHTPGHSIGWLTGTGGTGLFSGDAMHSALQVYRSDWNSGFCLDAEQATATRRSILEAAVERDAVLLPAHFSAPHAFKVKGRGDGFAVVNAL